MALFLTGADDERLDRHAVHGINNKIERTREQTGCIALGQKLDHGRNFTSGVDGVHTIGQDRDLGLADGLSERGEWAIDVGDADVIEIDQRQSADAAARKGLDHP